MDHIYIRYFDINSPTLVREAAMRDVLGLKEKHWNWIAVCLVAAAVFVFAFGFVPR